MQPYFIPYPGYFRLFALADIVVLYDCVQFTRRGFVHRNQLRTQQGLTRFLTLPLTKQPMNTRIIDLQFQPEATHTWQTRLQAFHILHPILNNPAHPFYASLTTLGATPRLYITHWLELLCQQLHLPFNVAYSSTLNLPDTLRGAERILAICRHFNAATYLNAPGGKSLYCAETFKNNHIALKFLTPYCGDHLSTLHQLLSRGPREVRKTLLNQLELADGH